MAAVSPELTPRRSRRWWNQFVLGVVAVLATLNTSGLNAAASSPANGMGCQPYANDRSRTDDGVDYLDWSGDNSGLAGGMYAQILNYSPWVQPNRGGTSAWVMIQQQDNPDVYVQTGWWEDAYWDSQSNDNNRYTFYQVGYWNASHNRYEFFTKPSGYWPLGKSVYYTVNYNPYDSNYPFSFDANNQFLGHEGWYIPDGTLNEGLVSGEVHTLASQMPGGHVGPSEVFSDIHYWWPRGSSGSWKNFNPTRGQTPWFTNRANVSGGGGNNDEVAINDIDCAH